MKMKKISKVKIALITLTAIVALVVVKVLTAQFLYTEMGYSPVETQQESAFIQELRPCMLIR